VLQQALQVAPLADQLRRTLLPDALHSRNVVARVAHQRAQVENALRRHAEALLHLGWTETAVLHAVEERDPLADQLHQVLVRGDDRHPGLGRRLLHQGCDDVVGLEARDLEDRDAVGLHQLANHGNLRREILGLGLASRLVVPVELVAKAGAARIEDDHHDVGLLLAQHLAEHVDEPVGRSRGRAVGSAQTRDGEEGAVQAVGAVDEKDPGRSTRRRRHGFDPDSRTA
jgi:hypothetical protein